jgi:hypothetical protein
VSFQGQPALVQVPECFATPPPPYMPGISRRHELTVAVVAASLLCDAESGSALCTAWQDDVTGRSAQRSVKPR